MLYYLFFGKYLLLQYKSKSEIDYYFVNDIFNGLRA